MKFPLSLVAGALQSSAPAVEQQVTGWSVDSRTLASGDMFFALRGPNHDGHQYLKSVFEKGAAAAVVDHIPQDKLPAWNLLLVKDTQLALDQLGAWARRRWGRDVIGVTGSAGKTTTKDVIAALLSVDRPVGKTVGNLNNHVGVPLTLLRLPEESQAAVIEMGMNHSGEIAALAAIANPQVGVVTNVGYAHVENFDGIEGVAAAKRELIEALTEDGVAVLNADDERVSKFASMSHGRVVTYGLSEKADIRAERVKYSQEGVSFQVRGTLLESKLNGRHGVSNLLAGVAVAFVYGIEVSRLTEAARAIELGAMRGRLVEKNGIFHINDCYNSNPDAAKAMVDLLMDTPAKRRVAVLGEMLELGRWAEPLHREVGRYVAKSGVNVLVGIRGAAKQAVQAAVDAGLAKDAAYFFEEPVEAGEWLKQNVSAGDAVLWKGSRGTRVELAFERFME